MPPGLLLAFLFSITRYPPAISVNIHPLSPGKANKSYTQTTPLSLRRNFCYNSIVFASATFRVIRETLDKC